MDFRFAGWIAEGAHKIKETWEVEGQLFVWAMAPSSAWDLSLRKHLPDILFASRHPVELENTQMVESQC